MIQVRGEDAGNNFFLSADSIGKSRGEVAVRCTQNMFVKNLFWVVLDCKRTFQASSGNESRSARRGQAGVSGSGDVT